MTGNRRTVLVLVGALLFMCGLVVVSVPLYSLFCRVTGYAGTPRTAESGPAMSMAQTITVRFDAGVMKGLPWRFSAPQSTVTVHLGEPTLAVFTAENISDEPIIGTAAFNVAPMKAGPYVDKIQCFCFSEQRLEPGQKAEMAVSFFIDPAIATDPDTSDIRTVTLSYTFFKARKQPAAAAGPAQNLGNAGRTASHLQSEGKS